MVNDIKSVVVLLSVLALSCAPKEVNYAVKIVSQSCEMALDPFAGVQFLKVRVFALDIPQGIEVISAKDPATRQIKIPEIPAGMARIIEVRAYDGEPQSGGKLVSMGRSKAFDVPDVVPEELMGKPIDISVVLRKLNSFSAPVDVTDPTKCQRMSVARAGHTATLLKNGKVFLAGGYNLMVGGPNKVALATSEIYDPGTGKFAAAKELNVSGQPNARAFHTATRVPSGQVMLWGGETYASTASGTTTSARGIILFYDPDEDYVGAVPGALNRTQHQAAIDKDGRVLIVGGLKSDGTPVSEVEWMDTATNTRKIVDAVTLPMLGGSAVPIKVGEFIAVAGGSDGTALKTEIRYFKFSAGTFAESKFQNPPQLAQPGRRRSAGIPIRDGVDMLLLGGYSDAALFKPLGSSEIVNSSNTSVGPGPAVGERGDICAVVLKDGSVLSIGGRTSDMVGTAARSDARVELIKATTAGAISSIGAPSLATARYFHTCTALDDGTVLVTGGVNEAANGTIEILQDAWIYQPSPAVQ
jgi:hypothetical protein